MKVTSFILATLFGSALAAPAIVWKATDGSEGIIHSSKPVQAKDILAGAVGDDDSSSLASAVFVLGRAEDGSESLSTTAGSGSLPGVASKYNTAACYHSHVSGVRGGYSVAHDVENSGRSAVEVSLNEFSRKLTSIGSSEPFQPATEVVVGETGMLSTAQKQANQRARALAKADVVVINVPVSADMSKLDEAIVKAIEHKSVNSVIVTAVRSTDEIKEERSMEYRRRMKVMEAAGRALSYNSGARRLEQQNNQDDYVDAANNLAGVYYVHMTPNIFAGLFFGLFFAVVAYTGLSCMGMIAGQDVYVNKMPVIGREA